MPVYASHEDGKFHIVPQCALGKETPPVSCAVLTVVNVGKLILGISGSVALALFVYGGFLMVASAGNETLITKGKDVLKGATIGLIIIFGAYAGVTFAVRSLAPTVLACINTDTGAYQANGSSCGDGAQRGSCQSGICVPSAPGVMPPP